MFVQRWKFFDQIYWIMYNKYKIYLEKTNKTKTTRYFSSNAEDRSEKEIVHHSMYSSTIQTQKIRSGKKYIPWWSNIYVLYNAQKKLREYDHNFQDKVSNRKSKVRTCKMSFKLFFIKQTLFMLQRLDQSVNILSNIVKMYKLRKNSISLHFA